MNICSAGGPGAGFSNGLSYQLLSSPLKSADSLMCGEGCPGFCEEEQSFSGGSQSLMQNTNMRTEPQTFAQGQAMSLFSLYVNIPAAANEVMLFWKIK